MILIRVKLRDSDDEIEIGEGGRFTERSLRNLFVEMHMRLDGETGGEPIRYRTEEGEAREIDPANIEPVRIIRDGEDITDEIVGKAGEN